jgi:hypothetical protein
MSLTDQDLLLTVEQRLIEDASFSSGLWTVAEVLGYANQRQTQFLKETHLVAAWADLDWTPGQPERDLPPDWIDTILARWRDTATGDYHVLPASDTFELDHVSPQTALTVGTPSAYRDGDTGTLRLAIAPPPQAAGDVELLYVAVGETLDGSGILFTVPDDFVPYVVYGVMADMLGKDGRGQDLVRARYCDLRYQEGVALSAALLDGWG